jgi:glyoxylase-like metal-dependent hydrolase (beta-lactamase superfamily II)
MDASYDKGLVEVADGVHAYLQPDGSWGWSNAGLVVGDGGSLLVDTLFDLHLTADMLATMAPLTQAGPITTVVNTHANGDHCFGNQLVVGEGVEVVATEASAREMEEVPASLLAALTAGAPDLPPPLGEWITASFGRFDFTGIATPPPDRTFTGRTTVDAGGRPVELIEVGPAHTGGDLLAWLPDARVVFTGDILFVGSTPIMWAGPIGNWIAACEQIEAMDAAVVVPGHGPLATPDRVRAVGDYLRFVRDGATARHAAGLGPAEAARDLDADIDAGPFADWLDRERIMVTVDTFWRELEPDRPPTNVAELFQHMADYTAAHRR